MPPSRRIIVLFRVDWAGGEGVGVGGAVLKLRVNSGRMEFDGRYFLMICDLTRSHAIVAGLIRKYGQIEETLQGETRYLALISHEIRTPINAVIGLSQLMLEGKAWAAA